MGGDTLRCFTSEDESSLDNDYPEFPPHASTYYRDDDESFSGSNGFFPGQFDEMGSQISSNPVEFDGNLRRRKIAYREIMKNYDELWVRRESLYQAKCKILSYTPGSWINNMSDKKRSNYVIPKTTTLLLIGPRGSGKSSLVNRISRVFEDDKLFASERAQVTYDSSVREGTYFLQEYMIPRDAISFCLFDTRSLSENFADNDEMLRRWMAKGVRHGELIIRDSDSSSLKTALKCKAEQSGPPSTEVRRVNFVVFVVNGFSVLRAMNGDKKEDRRYMEMVMETFSCPYLSFKDDKPVIVVTHGDLLSLGDRARVCVYLGEKLGVPPAKQIFDIPDNSESSTELTIVDMIKYSLEHADKNLPCRESREWVDRIGFSEDIVDRKVFKTSILTSIFLAILLGIACVTFPLHWSQKHDEPVFTPAINRHAKSQVNQPYEPLMTFPSDSQSKSEVNQSHESQARQSHQPRPKSGHQNPEPDPESLPPLPDKLEEATVVPTFPSKPAMHGPSKQAESRSSSPERRHPKSAVKWHKTRNLWLHSD